MVDLDSNQGLSDAKMCFQPSSLPELYSLLVMGYISVPE